MQPERQMAAVVQDHDTGTPGLCGRYHLSYRSYSGRLRPLFALRYHRTKVIHLKSETVLGGLR